MAPLHWAALRGHGSVVDQLVQARADVNLTDMIGNTPLDLANEEGHTEVSVRLLKAAGDDEAAETTAAPQFRP